MRQAFRTLFSRAPPGRYTAPPTVFAVLRGSREIEFGKRKSRVELMTDRRQEHAALALFLESVRSMGSSDLVVQKDDPADFPDFVLLNRATNQEIWVEIVEAVESGELIAAERRAQRLYNAAAREYRNRGEEVVLTVSSHGVEDVTPSPGFGVTGIIVPGRARKITPSEWIARALDRKGRPNRYGVAERARTTLVIDCSREVFIGSEDAVDVRAELEGKTLGFMEVWAVSANWSPSSGLLLAP
jgi:hypothetical protein